MNIELLACYYWWMPTSFLDTTQIMLYFGFRCSSSLRKSNTQIFLFLIDTQIIIDSQSVEINLYDCMFSFEFLMSVDIWGQNYILIWQWYENGGYVLNQEFSTDPLGQIWHDHSWLAPLSASVKYKETHISQWCSFLVLRHVSLNRL